MTDMTSRYRAAWESARRRARQHQQTVRHLSQAVWVAPDRQGGTACVGGTRVSAALIASLLADGMTVEEIRDGYPSVTADGARAAAAFAARYVDRYAEREQVAHNGCSQQHSEQPGPLADQLTEHREAIEYALRHTLTAWQDATGHAEGTAAGTLHRALDWITGHPTHNSSDDQSVCVLLPRAEGMRMARALLDVTGHHTIRLVDPAAPDLDAEDLVEPGDEVPTLAELADRVEQLARRLDDVETEVHRRPGTYGDES